MTGPTPNAGHWERQLRTAAALIERQMVRIQRADWAGDQSDGKLVARLNAVHTALNEAANGVVGKPVGRWTPAWTAVGSAFLVLPIVVGLLVFPHPAHPPVIAGVLAVSALVSYSASGLAIRVLKWHSARVLARELVERDTGEVIAELLLLLPTIETGLGGKSTDGRRAAAERVRVATVWLGAAGAVLEARKRRAALNQRADPES